MQKKYIIIKQCLSVLVMLFACVISDAHSSSATSIPKAAEAHRATLIKLSHQIWGFDAPIAVFAAQIHQESRWNTTAKSPVGAMGLAQFMPATAKWMPEIDPQLATPAPYNPGWALRAMLVYDLWLWKQVAAVNDYEKMAFVLSAYNGGLGWVYKDKTLARKKGLNPLIYFNSVETVNAGRSAANIKENRLYPSLILNNQRIYQQAGWGKGLEVSQ